MLFKIENCSPNIYLNHLDKLRALENLIHTNGLRKNIVFLDRNTISDVKYSDIYSASTKNFVIDIEKQRREYGAIVEKLAVYSIVDFDFKGVQCIRRIDQWIIRIGYDFFCDPENISPVNLVTEGKLDFDFYSLIAKYYAKYLSSTNLEVNFKFNNGGGSQSKPIFDNLVSEGKIVLCITDNDKSHPNKGEGSTSSVFTISDRSYNGKSLAHVIDVREIESLIPLKAIENTLSSNDQVDTFEEIKSLNTYYPQFRQYFDHKEGLNLENVINIDNDHGNFWLPALSNISRFSNRECFKDSACYSCNSCPKMIGFGDNMLKRVVADLSKSNLRRLQIEPEVISHWRNIGELMMAWGCVPVSSISRAS